MNVRIFKRTSNRLAAALVCAAAAVGLGAAAGVAQAGQPAEEGPSVVVAYGDLDLGTDSGNVSLYQRITSAARQVCPEADPRDLSALEVARTCQRAAIDRAVRQLNNSRLAAVHSEHTRRG